MVPRSKNLLTRAALALVTVSFAAAGCGEQAAPPPDVAETKAALSAGAVQGGSGILWQLPNGEIHVWDMLDGVTPKDLLIGSADPNVWTPVATGDFNKDGAGDILFRSTANELSDWFLTDTQVVTTSPATSNAPTSFFHSAQIPMTPLAGDVNGDGIADIVWNGTRPSITWITANGTTTPASTTTSASFEPVLAIADFDNDAAHKADVLRHRSSDGMVTIEYNQGAATDILGSTFEWAVVGTGDFNGDQASDVLWYNAGTGQVLIWIMKPGVQAVDHGVIAGVVSANSGWSLKSVGDFNHDGISDILWIHTSGIISIWTIGSDGSVDTGAAVAIPAGANFAGVITLGPPAPPSNITTLPSYVSSGNGQTMAPIRFKVPTQRTTDSVELWENINGIPTYRTRLTPSLEFSPNSMRLDVLASGFTNGTHACLTLKAWEQGRVSAKSAQFCLGGLPPPVPSFDYTMQARFGLDDNGDGAIDLVPSASSRVALLNNGWPVNLNACASSDANAGGTVTTYLWSGRGGPFGPPTAACTSSMTLPSGDNDVTLAVKTSDGRTATKTMNVFVKNTNIVVMGDSLTAGEGNPLKVITFPTFWGTPADASCHRSANSFAARAALALERSDTRSSVTFVSVACTGAVLDQIIGTAMQGSNPPQMDQVKTALCGSPTTCVGGVPPKIDALIFNGGVNDIGRVLGTTSGFGDVISKCVADDLLGYTRCGDNLAFGASVQNQIKTITARLPSVAIAINSLGPKQVFTGGYPSPAFNDTGSICTDFTFVNLHKDIAGSDINLGKNGHMTANDILWLDGIDNQFAGILQTAYTAAPFNFKFVNYSPIFANHGYCAGEHWFETYNESWSHQLDQMGTLHPNDYGHVAMGNALLASMVQAGFGDANTVNYYPVQTFVAPTISTTRYDWGTQCKVFSKDLKTSQIMHCCPPGWAMVGLSITNGALLKCEKITAATSGGPFLDTGTQRTIGGLQMHACPAGAVMTGFQGNSGNFACQAVSTTTTESLDPGTQDWESNYSIHVCPAGRAMTGAQITQNKYGCGTNDVTN